MASAPCQHPAGRWRTVLGMKEEMRYQVMAAKTLVGSS